MNIKASVIEPNESSPQEGINCSVCSLMNYTHAEYALFKGLQKLTFFTLKADKKRFGPVCHFCLNEQVMKLSPEGVKEVEITVQSKDGAYQQKCYEQPRS